MTSGEFGRVNRLKAHRDGILTWADDERPAVRAFVGRYAHQLENSLRAEQRSSEESIALRRLEWDRPHIENDPVPPDDPEE